MDKEIRSRLASLPHTDFEKVLLLFISSLTVSAREPYALPAKPNYAHLFELHKRINEMIHTSVSKLVSMNLNENAKYPVDSFINALEQAAGDVGYSILNRDMQSALERLNSTREN